MFGLLLDTECVRGGTSPPPPPPQKHPFILMYEERSVDVASYVCRILDLIPTSPMSPMYVD